MPCHPVRPALRTCRPRGRITDETKGPVTGPSRGTKTIRIVGSRSSLSEPTQPGCAASTFWRAGYGTTPGSGGTQESVLPGFDLNRTQKSGRIVL